MNSSSIQGNTRRIQPHQATIWLPRARRNAIDHGTATGRAVTEIMVHAAAVTATTCTPMAANDAAAPPSSPSSLSTTASHLCVSRLSSRLSSRRDTTTDAEDSAEDDELELEFALITAMASRGADEDEEGEDVDVAPGLRSSFTAGVTVFVTEADAAADDDDAVEEDGAQVQQERRRLGASRLSSRLTSRRATTTDTEASDGELDEMELEFAMLLADSTDTTPASSAVTTATTATATATAAAPTRLQVSRLSGRRETTTDCSESEAEADDAAANDESDDGLELERFAFDIASMRALCSSDEEQLDFEDPFTIGRRLCGRSGRRAAVDMGGSTGIGSTAADDAEAAATPTTALLSVTGAGTTALTTTRLSTRLSRRSTSSCVNDDTVDMDEDEAAYDADSGDSDSEAVPMTTTVVAAAAASAPRVAFPNTQQQQQQPRRRRKHSGLRRVALKQEYLARTKAATAAASTATAAAAAINDVVDMHTAFRRRNNSDEVKANAGKADGTLAKKIGIAASVPNCTPTYTISETATVVISDGRYTMV